MVRLQFWDLDCVEYLFIGITLSRNGNTCQGPICGSNRSVQKLFVLDRNTWCYITTCKKPKKLHQKFKYEQGMQLPNL